MKQILHVVIGLGLIAAIPAVAQTKSSTTHNQANGTSGPASSQANPATQAAVTQKLRSNLEQAGFKEVRVLPESFLVRAKDKDGHPVMMIVNPDSVTEVTQMSGANPSSSSSHAVGGNSGANSSTASGSSAPSK